MALDVTAQRVIPLSPEKVAAYAMDYRHDHEWTQGIRSAELTRPAENGGFGPHAEVTRTAYFMGRRIDYVLKVTAYDPPSVLDMVSVVAPMPMQVTYRFGPHADGTLASIRVRGGRGGFYRLAGPLMAFQVRRSINPQVKVTARYGSTVTN
jgi:hypothetical protein